MSDHRHLYPEQYRHPLVGSVVETPDETVGVVTRVVRSRFGELAILDGQHRRAWALRCLEILEDPSE